MVLKWVRPSQDWNITYIGNGEYLITLKNKYIPMTGVNVITEFAILEPHKLKKLELKHTNSAKAESSDNLKITFQRRMGLLDALLHDLYEDAVGTTASDKRFLFGDNYEYPSQYYRLTLNTTNTDRIYPELYIELLPKLDKPTIPEVTLSDESIQKLVDVLSQLVGVRDPRDP